MANPKLLFRSDEKTDTFVSKFGNVFKRFFINKNKIFDDYKLLNAEIMQVVSDIEEIKHASGAKGINIDIELEALEYSKKVLENKLVDIESNFYDVKKGLWIGVAVDLNSNDYEPFLLYLPWKNLHNHFEVYGTSGYGKSRLMAVILRQMIHFGWSIMAVDPKGGEKQEVAQWVYDFAAEAGRNESVMRIMATFPELSDKGNVLYGQGDDEIASTTSALTVSGSGTMSSDEQFFSGQVYRTTLSILSCVRFLEKAAYTKEDIDKRIMDEVIKYQNFKDHKGSEFIEPFSEKEMADIHKVSYGELENNDETKHLINPFNRTLITFRELSYYSNYDRLVELHSLVKDYPVLVEDRSLAELKNNAIRLISDVISKEKSFFEKVGDSLSILLSQLAYGPIGSIMCDIRINPIVQKIRDKEGVIIIFQPAPMRFERVSEMMIKCYVRMFLSLFGTVGASGRGIHKRVALIVDEAKPMMFPGIEEIYNKARQLGMTIGALYQSKSDPKFKLGELLADIVSDNTGTSIIMKQVSASSLEECAGSLGTKKVAVNIAMKENDDMGGRSSVIHEDRELASASDIDDLGIGEGIVKHYGRKCHVTFPYQKDPSNINVVMPKLDAEIMFEAVQKIEQSLANQIVRIDAYNSDKAKEGGVRE